MNKKKHRVVAVLVIVSMLFILLLLKDWKPYLKLDKGVYPVGTVSLTGTFQNILPNQYHTGSRYIIEKLYHGEWEVVKRDKRGGFFNDDSFSPVSGAKITFDLTKYSDGLTEGTYQIKMTLYNDKNEATGIGCEFVVE